MNRDVATRKGDKGGLMAKSGYHHGDLRAALLREARKMIAKSGIGDFSMRDLSRRLGVSHAAAYRHFESRDALLGVLIMDANLRFFQCLRGAKAAAPGGPVDKLSAIGESYMRFGLGDPADLELLFSGESMEITRRAFESGRVDPAAMENMNSFSILKDTVIECIRSGVFSVDSDPDATSILFWSYVHGYCVLAREGVLDSMGAERGMDEAAVRAAVMESFGRLLRR
jgi:AcrR family transcriptional regulator